MAAQDRRTPLAATIDQLRVQRIKAFHDWHRRHEVAPDIADQPLHLAFVIAFTRQAKPVREQVVALQFGKHMRAHPLAALRLHFEENLHSHDCLPDDRHYPQVLERGRNITQNFATFERPSV